MDTQPYSQPKPRIGDEIVQSTIARMTRGLSPQAYGLAFTDWISHLATAPSFVAELLIKTPLKIAAHPQDLKKLDLRFSTPGWQRQPFRSLARAYAFQDALIDAWTTEVPGVEPHHERMVNSTLKQLHQAFSPASVPLLNPDVLEETRKTRGMNFVRGFRNWLEDTARTTLKRGVAGAAEFKVGEKVAVTPGKVVYRNDLIELIQYTPSTDKVRAEPILIVPAWIMKFYILDLSPKNSLVKYLVEQGFTVFMISWRNPGSKQHRLAIQDYLDLGIGSAVSAISEIVPGEKIHAMGYCLGGTLLSIFAAAQARDGKELLKTLTLLAAQTDFSEAGEIRNFIDESQIEILESSMDRRGYLDGAQMGAAFASLRATDLIWSRITRDYFMGQRQKLIDIMAWNADSTRMPAKMHSQYLRSLYLNNDLAQGRFEVSGRSVAIQDLRLPLFVVGTQSDHVAPWRSVFKIHLLNSGELTFLLTSGGHNAGILSEPGHAGRSFQVLLRRPGERYSSPDDWLKSAESHEGSWWIEWSSWLRARSSRDVPPPFSGGAGPHRKALGNAPGNYVLER